MMDIRTRHQKKTWKRTDGPGGIEQNTDGHGLHLGIAWPSLLDTNKFTQGRKHNYDEGRLDEDGRTRINAK